MCDRRDRMRMDHHFVIQRCMKRRFDRRPQRNRGIKNGCLAAAIPGLFARLSQCSIAIHCDEYVGLDRICEFSARGFDPHDIALFDRGIAPGPLDLQRVLAKLGRELSEFCG